MSTESEIVVTFYRFVHLPDYRELREKIREVCRREGILGTILLAEEGVNATISGSDGALESLFDYFDQDERLRKMRRKVSPTGSRRPFKRLKVRLKREIVTMGAPEVDPTRNVGTYVPPSRWEELLSDPSVTVVDTRNLYESAIGSFRGARIPGILRFRDFPGWAEENLDPDRDRKVALFCTGGIRCEKATSYLLSRGFDEVYHLEGGILSYLALGTEDSTWEGECFVFDNRVSVDPALEEGNHTMEELQRVKERFEEERDR